MIAYSLGSLAAALILNAWAAPLPPGARVLGLPASVKTQWVLPEGPGGDCLLAADVAGAPWLGCRKRFVVGAGYATSLAAEEPFESLAWLEDGSLIGARGDSFGLYTKADAVRLSYTRLGRRPGKRVSVHRGAGQTAYVVASGADGSDVILLSREGEKWSPRLLFSAPGRVTAATGDGERSFIAQGRRILAIAGADRDAVPLLDHPSADITDIQYDRTLGLFYATARGAGYLGSRYRDEFLVSSKLKIDLRKSSLYALFSTGAVLKIDVSGFGKLDAELAGAGLEPQLEISAAKPAPAAVKPAPPADPFANMTRAPAARSTPPPSGPMGFKDD